MINPYLNPGPSRDDVDATPGALLLEFGAPWCGHCQTAAPAAEKALVQFPGLRHIRIEDGPGRPLGRSFRVKLWPTFIALSDGVEVARVVRPTTAEQVGQILAKIL